MEVLRRSAKGTTGKVIVVVIALAFSLFGVQSAVDVIANAGNTMKVNGSKITQAEISRTAFQIQQQYQRGGVDPSMLTNEMLQNQAINQLIQLKVLQTNAQAQGLAVSSQTLDAEIRSNPEFFVDGEFNLDRANEIILQQRSTVTQYRDDIENNLVIGQQVEALRQTNFATQNEIEAAYLLDAQTRNFSYKTFAVADLVNDVVVEEEEIASYYEENPEQFQTLEQVKVEYIVLERDNFLTDIEVSAEELEDEYQAYKAQLESQSSPTYSQILVDTFSVSEEEALALINKAKAELDAGASFESVVETYSTDPVSKAAGGNIGTITEDSLYGDAMVSAALAMSELGQVSEPIKTDFGYHIVSWTGSNQQEIESFENRKNDLETTIRTAKAGDAFAEAADVIAEMVYVDPSLDAAADQYGLQVQTSDWFNRTNAQGILAVADVLNASFSDEVLLQDENSSVIAADSATIVVVRKNDYQEAELKAIENVTADIQATLANEKATALAKEQAELAVSEMSNVSASEVSFDDSWVESLEINRAGTGLDRLVVNKAFEMAHPGDKFATQNITNSAGDAVVIVLTGVNAPDLSDTQAIETFSNRLNGAQGIAEFDNYFKYLQDSAKLSGL